jgi:hypothetical protein
MRGLAWLILTVSVAVGTMFVGWWSVPLLAAAWGTLSERIARAMIEAAVAGLVAWSILLAVTALEGPVWYLAGNLGGVFQLPGPVILLLTVLFPALLAGAAAGLFAALRAIVRRRAGDGDEITTAGPTA